MKLWKARKIKVGSSSCVAVYPVQNKLESTLRKTKQFKSKTPYTLKYTADWDNPWHSIILSDISLSLWLCGKITTTKENCPFHMSPGKHQDSVSRVLFVDM